MFSFIWGEKVLATDSHGRSHKKFLLEPQVFLTHE